MSNTRGSSPDKIKRICARREPQERSNPSYFDFTLVDVEAVEIATVRHGLAGDYCVKFWLMHGVVVNGCVILRAPVRDHTCRIPAVNESGSLQIFWALELSVRRTAEM